MTTKIVSDDWTEAFATMAPTPAEVEAERAYWAEQDRQEDYADYLAARAEELAAEEGATDDEPEPEPPAPAAARRERVAAYDGLTKSERQHLYVPARYVVEKVGPIQFRAVNIPTGAEFQVSVIFGRFARVTSNTGNEYLLHNGECHCAHKQNGAEVCKHEAATAKVMEVWRQDTIAVDVAEEVARIQAERERLAA